jgi:hypothetical protein
MPFISNLDMQYKRCIAYYLPVRTPLEAPPTYSLPPIRLSHRMLVLRHRVLDASRSCIGFASILPGTMAFGLRGPHHWQVSLLWVGDCSCMAAPTLWVGAFHQLKRKFTNCISVVCSATTGTNHRTSPAEPHEEDQRAYLRRPPLLKDRNSNYQGS